MSIVDCQHSNNTKILFATQYKNQNISFCWSSAVSSGPAFLRAFCQWKIEHQIRKRCVKGLILWNMAGHERDADRL